MNRFNPHGRREDKRMSSALYFMIRLRVDFQCCVFPTNVYVRSAQNTYIRSLTRIEHTHVNVRKKKKKKVRPVTFL